MSPTRQHRGPDGMGARDLLSLLGVLASSLGQSLYSPAALGHLASLVPGDA